MKKILLFVLSALFIAALIVPASSAAKYKMIDLGIPTGFMSAAPYDINDLGRIAGALYSYINDNPITSGAAFIGTADAGIVNLSKQLNLITDGANGINNFGDVVGTTAVFYGSDIESRAYLWNQSSGLLKLPDQCTSALSVNDSRQVLGEGIDAASHRGLFFWQPNTGVVQQDVDSYYDEKSLSINSSGVAYNGWRQLVSSDTTTELETFNDSNGFPMTRGINNKNEVVGSQDFDDGDHLLFWDSEGNLTDLTAEIGLPCCRPNDINDSGQIVGHYDLPHSNTDYTITHAFVWSKALGFCDLGTLGGAYSYATAINSAGWITGGSTNGNSRVHAVIWIPNDGRDVTLPTVSITSPTRNATYRVTKPSLNISGTASDNIGITSAVWRNDRGGSGECTGTTKWSVNGIVLQSGLNVISVLVSDAAGNKALDTLSVTYTPRLSATITADDSSITEGQSTTIRWSSTLATAVVSSNFGAKAVSGVIDVSPTKTTIYQITVKSADGRKVSASTTVRVLPLLPKVTLSADATSIYSGQSTTIRWTSENATKVISSNFSATAVSGTATVSPKKTTAYNITVADSKGKKISSAVTVKVIPRVPKVTIAADSTTLTKGQSTTIRWSSENATSVVSSSFGTKDLSGSLVVTPSANKSYSIIVVGSSGSRASASVTVKVLPSTPKVTLKANPITIKSGQSSTLTWTSNMAASIVSSNFGATTLNGSKIVSPTRTTIYTILMRTTSGGTMSAAATVAVVK